MAIVVLAIPVCVRSATGDVPARESRAPADRVAVRALLADADSTAASFYVLVENMSGDSVEVPRVLRIHISESYRLAEAGTCQVHTDWPLLKDQGVVRLGNGNCFGCRVRVEKMQTASAVRFAVDLGAPLGRIDSDWVAVADW